MLKCLKNQGKDEQRTRRNYGNVHGTAQWRLLTPHARSSCWSTRKKNPEKQRAKATNRKAATELPTADKPVKECSPYVRIKEVHVVTILPTWGKQKRNRVLVTVWGFGHHPTGRGKNAHLLSEEAVKNTCWHYIPGSSDLTSWDSTGLDRSLHTPAPYLTVCSIRTRRITSLYISEMVRLLLFLFFFVQHRLCTGFFQNVGVFSFSLWFLNCRNLMISGKSVAKELKSTVLVSLPTAYAWNTT